jgi:hypothetical protein
MQRASELVLPGFPLRTEAEVVLHPDRYMDARGRAMWDLVFGLLDREKVTVALTQQIVARMLHTSPIFC